jgi:hypothetical protein
MNEFNVSETGYVSILRWKGEEESTQLGRLELVSNTGQVWDKKKVLVTDSNIPRLALATRLVYSQ